MNTFLKMNYKNNYKENRKSYQQDLFLKKIKTMNKINDYLQLSTYQHI